MDLYATSELKSYIYNRFEEVELFAFYFNVDAQDITRIINKNKKIHNNLRVDKHPSLSFKYIHDKVVGTKLKAIDYGNSRYSGDLIDIAGIYYNLNSSNSKQFVEICNKIIDMANNNHIYDLASKHIPKVVVEDKIIKDILIISREYNNLDMQIWNQWKVFTPEILLEARIYPVDSAWIFTNEENPNYEYNKTDPCYAMYLDNIKGKDTYELFFPFRSKSSKYPRYITNTPLAIKCVWELDKADILLITKSRRDAVAIRSYLKTNSEASFISQGRELKIVTTCLASESVVLPESFANKLNSIYPIILTLTDFDKQGIICGNIHRDLYGFNPIYLTNGKFGTKDYGAKDFSDLLKFKYNTIPNVINDLSPHINNLYGNYLNKNEQFPF